MGPGYPTCRRSPRGPPPPCPPASAPAGVAPPRPSGAGWRAVTWPPGGSLSGAFRKGIPSAATLWPLSTTVLPTSAGSSGVRSDTLSTGRRYSYPYPSPSHDPWPGLRPSPDRPVPVRQVLKPVGTAPGTLPDHAGHRDGQRIHPRPADPAAPSGQHHPARKPGQPLADPFVAAGVLEADQDRRDVVPRFHGRPDPPDVGGAGPPPGVVDPAHRGLPGGGLADSAAYGGESTPLTAVSGESPQGEFRHLPLKNRSLAVFWRTLIRRS